MRNRSTRVLAAAMFALLCGCAADPADGNLSGTIAPSMPGAGAQCRGLPHGEELLMSLGTPDPRDTVYPAGSAQAAGSTVQYFGTLGSVSPAAEPVSSMVVTASARRTFLGRAGMRDGRALTMLTHGPGGTTVAQDDIEVSRPASQDETVTVRALGLAPSGRTLYVLVHHTDVLGTSRESGLVTLQLDESGAPVGELSFLPLEDVHQTPLALALHPSGRTAYVSTYGAPAVVTIPLGSDGTPSAPAKVALVGNGYMKRSLSVHPSGERLYAGSRELEVFPLAEDGTLLDRESALSFPPPERFVHEDARLDYHLGELNIVATAHAVFRQQDARPSLGSTGWPIQSWQLDYVAVDGSGRLVDSQVTRRADVFHSWIVPMGTGIALAEPVVVDGSILGTVMSRLDFENGVAGARPTPMGPIVDKRVVWQFGVSDDGVLSVPVDWPEFWTGRGRTRDPIADVRLSLRVSATAPSPAPYFGKDTVSVVIPLAPDSIVRGLSPARFDEWMDVDLGTSLDDVAVTRALSVSLSAAICASDAAVEVRLTGLRRATGETFQETRLAQAKGCTLPLFVDGNAMAEGKGGARIRTYDEQMALYAGYVDPSWPASQPKEFPISCGVNVGGGSGLESLRASLRIMQAVGCNGFLADNGETSFPVAGPELHTMMDAYGFRRREYGVYLPNDTYFSFDPRMREQAILSWAEGDVVSVMTKAGTPLDRIDSVTLADEPGWLYPKSYELVRASAEGHAAFVAFMKKHGQTPELLGHADWSTVMPISQLDAGTESARRLYYFTHKFFSDSASEGMSIAKKALERTIGHAIRTPVNFNNWQSWMVPAPNEALNGERKSREAGIGSMNWYQSGRTSAHTLYSEDWFWDAEAPSWTYRAQSLRSAASLGEESFGGYVVGQTSGEIRDALSLRALSIVGRGGKSLGWYTFGPEPLFPGNSWSDHPPAYGELQRASARIRFADNIFAHGSGASPDIAILSPQDAYLWGTWRPREPGAVLPSELDARGVSLLLAHEGHDAHVFDDEAIARGVLADQGIRALYVSSPNVSRGAAEAIVRFAEAGGNVVLGMGAGARDEFNTEAALLDSVRAGCGSVTRLPNLPGAEYLARGGARHRGALPTGFRDDIRKSVATLMTSASRPAVRVSAPMVEALRVDHNRAAAISLLNWGEQTGRAVTIRVRGGARFVAVTSSEGQRVSTRRVGEDLDIDVVLDRVMVLKFE
jgi:hypothetical protein